MKDRTKSIVWAGAVALLLILQGRSAVWEAEHFVAQPVLASGTGTGNLLANADFEEVTRNVPAQWILDPKLQDRGTVSVDPHGSRPSSRALKLIPNSRNTDKDKPFAVGQVVSTRGLTSKQLSVHASMRSEGGAAGYVLVFATKGGKTVGSVVFEQIDSNPAFKFQKDYLDVKNADQVIFACATNTTHGSVSFDDLFLGLENQTQGPTPSRSETALTAAIKIDATRVLRIVPRSLFGTNIEWVRNGNGVWDPSNRAPRSKIVDLAQKLGITLVRYPGGGFADFFHWRDAIGPNNSRPERSYVLDSGRSPALFGIRELMDFCRLTGSEPLIQVNVLTGKAEEAADWVSYCNSPHNQGRKANGSELPFRVRYWEIGNEQYIKNTSETPFSIPNTHLTKEEYVRRLQEFSKAMKRVDPTIAIGAVGGENFGRYRFIDDNQWDQAILEKAGSEIDFLSVHNSYGPFVMDDSKASFDDVYRALLAFPQLVQDNFKAINSHIETYAPQSSNRIKIAITEWGPLFAFQPSSKWIDHPKTLGSALYVASVFQAFLKSDRVDIATFFKLTEGSFMGWIGSNGEAKPSYYALQMYSQHFGAKLIQTSVSCPTFDSMPVGLVSAVQNVPYLDAVSSLSTDESELFLAVVNKHFETPIETRIKTVGFTSRRAAKQWVLTAPSIDANNGPDLDDVPAIGWGRQATAGQGSMFEAGRPGTVVPRESDFVGVSADFSYTFPPRSVTVLKLMRAPSD